MVSGVVIILVRVVLFMGINNDFSVPFRERVFIGASRVFLKGWLSRIRTIVILKRKEYI